MKLPLRQRVSGSLLAVLFAMLLALPQTTLATRFSDDEKALVATSHRTAVLRGRASWYGRDRKSVV